MSCERGGTRRPAPHSYQMEERRQNDSRPRETASGCETIGSILPMVLQEIADAALVSMAEVHR
jgi:hypothetical protein